MKLSPTVTNLIFLFLIFVISGCTAMRLVMSSSLSEPKFTYADYKIGETSINKVGAFLYFNAENPNDIGLKNVFVSYELYTSGKRFLTGQNIELTLAPNGITKIEVPIEIIYKDIFETVGAVASKVIKREKDLPIVVNVRIYGKPTVYSEIEEGAFFSFSFSTSKTIRVPIPHDDIDKAAKEVKDTFKKLF